MECENKNNLLDLYYSEGSLQERNEIIAHVADCKDCGNYIASIQEAADWLNKLENETPPAFVIDNILVKVNESVKKPAARKTGMQLTSVLQIAFGEIFLFGIIYFLKIQITLLPFWNALEKHWLVKSLGSGGVAVIIILIAGAFVTLSFAPVLLLESNNKRNFR